MKIVLLFWKLKEWLREKYQSADQYLYKKSVSCKLMHLGENCSFPRSTLFHGENYIAIGSGFQADERVKIDAWDEYRGVKMHPHISIGSDVSMNSDCYITCIASIIIGDGVMMGRNVFITDHLHGNTESSALMPRERKLYSKGGVKIGNHVLIGSNVCIMPGVTIGDDCIIRANAVVTHSMPERAVIGGIPAKVLKQL